MGGNRLKKWYGMRGGGRGSRVGFKTGDARREIFNEVFANLNALRLGGFGGGERQGRRVVGGGGRGMRNGREEGRRGRGEKGGKNVMPVVKGGRERRVLEPRGKEGRRSERRGWKEARELENVGVRTGAGHPVILCNGFIKRG